MENIESQKSPESELPKYENLSEFQKELLMSQFGIADAEAFDELVNNKSIQEGKNIFTNEEKRDYIKQILESEQ